MDGMAKLLIDFRAQRVRAWELWRGFLPQIASGDRTRSTPMSKGFGADPARRRGRKPARRWKEKGQPRPPLRYAMCSRSVVCRAACWQLGRISSHFPRVHSRTSPRHHSWAVAATLLFASAGRRSPLGPLGTYLLPPIIFADPTFAYAAIVEFEDNRMSHCCMIVGARKGMSTGRV